MESVYVVQAENGGVPAGVFSTEEKAIEWLNRRGAIQIESEERHNYGDIVFTDGEKTFEIIEEKIDPEGPRRGNMSSPFNPFMQEKMAQIKRQNPNISNKEAYKLAKNAWLDRSNTRSEPTVGYNVFMKQEISKIKRENPGISHQEAHREAMDAWFERSGSSSTKPSFNVFMEEEIATIKRENPDISHEDAYREAKNAWFEL